MSLSPHKIIIGGQSLAQLCHDYRRERVDYIISSIMKDVIAKNSGKRRLLRQVKKVCDESDEGRT